MRTILDKTEKKKILNPKRLKIIAGILIIIAFSIILDFVFPVTGSHFDESDVKNYYDEKLDLIANAVEQCEAGGTVPVQVLGGDNKRYDHLLASGSLDIYPRVKFNSIDNKRDMIEFKMRYPMYNLLFGKDGDRIINIRMIDPDILREYLKDKKNFPFFNQMYYEGLENGESFQVFFVLPQMKGSEYKNFRTALSWTDLDYGWRGYSYSDTSEFAIYGTVGRLIDGKWQSQKFFLGGD